MKPLAFWTAVAIAMLLGAPAAQAPEKLDYALIAKIKEEGLLRSQVMDHVSWLTDVYGPRITGSPQIKQAAVWVTKTLNQWGLANVHLESFPFGKGWSLVKFSAHLLEPQPQPIIGYARGWSPGTPGTITAEVVSAPIGSEADFEKYRGKLRGKIVLTQPARPVTMLEGRVVWRMSEQELQTAALLPIPPPNIVRTPPATAPTLEEKMQKFFVAEGVAVAIDRGPDNILIGQGEGFGPMQRTDGGTVFVGRLAQHDADLSQLVPSATIAVEHYNRMIRVIEKGLPVRMEIDIRTALHDEGPADGFNVIGELPGTDLAGEIVMIGAHFDSQYAGTGATDNAAGSAAMMEALRILKAVGAKPRRTIRLALWGGEELGHLGSRHYAKEHFGDAATMALKPDHAKLSGYFNIDNGSGRVRGVWLQGNLGIAPVFQQWMEPLKDLGVTTLGPRSVGGTDHQAFDEIGLPGFQFIQDRLEYSSRTHHSNMDVYDRIQKEDMMQIATVVATFAYNAAARDEKLPREALPTPPKPASASTATRQP